jgi:predicted metal-dependent phosphoesterase TrpH
MELDLHCHSFFSEDGVADPLEIVARAKSIGLDGFAITDHNTCDAVDYLRAKGLIRDDGEAVDGFLILPGVEVTTAEGHLLCIGAKLPDMKGRPAKEVVAAIHERGALAIPPHPYDLFRAGIRESVLDQLAIDALEVFNAATTLKGYNRRAFLYAQGRGLPMTASSDAHHSAAIGTARTIVNVASQNVNAVLVEIREGRTQMKESYLSATASFRKTFANFFRWRRRPDVREMIAEVERETGEGTSTDDLTR